MGKIVTIGGGDIRRRGTVAIDREIIRLTGKKKPRMLFIPTASYDSEKYWHYIDKYYSSLGCVTDVLYLLSTVNMKEVREKISKADIIYVGGGNTLKMMKRWRFLGVDKLLKKAWKNGTVMCGLSAGSICWYESGHSDSMSFYNPKKWEYINVKGLGFVKGIHCPHYNSETLGKKRKDDFKDMIFNRGGFGIAVDNNCAIEFFDDTFRVITSKRGYHAYKVYKKNGEVVSERIIESKKFLPLSELYMKN